MYLWWEKVNIVNKLVVMNIFRHYSVGYNKEIYWLGTWLLQVVFIYQNLSLVLYMLISPHPWRFILSGTSSRKHSQVIVLSLPSLCWMRCLQTSPGFTSLVFLSKHRLLKAGSLIILSFVSLFCFLKRHYCQGCRCCSCPSNQLSVYSVLCNASYFSPDA